MTEWRSKRKKQKVVEKKEERILSKTKNVSENIEQRRKRNKQEKERSE